MFSLIPKEEVEFMENLHFPTEILPLHRKLGLVFSFYYVCDNVTVHGFGY